MKKPIEVHVRLDAATFRRYCAFDTFRRRRRWYWPVLASMVLITLSLAGLLGWVSMSPTASGLLMGLGIAVPMVVFGLYFIQIEAQIRRRDLASAPAVYSLRLDGDELCVTNEQKREEPVRFPWDRLWGAYRRKGDIYLYVSPERALILPDGQASVSQDALWSFIRAHFDARRCFEL